MSAGNECYPVRLRYDGCAQQLIPGGLGFLEIYDVILHQVDLYNGVATIDSTGKAKKNGAPKCATNSQENFSKTI